MTGLLKDMLRIDYVRVLKARMLENRYNNTTLARRTGYSNAHIGNVLKGLGSDDALNAVCFALDMKITDLFKPGILDAGSSLSAADIREAS